MHHWRVGLARGGVQPLQDESKPTAGCHPPVSRYADLEAGSVLEMPVLQERPKRATGAHDQAHGRARDHALQVGASG